MLGVCAGALAAPRVSGMASTEEPAPSSEAAPPLPMAPVPEVDACAANRLVLRDARLRSTCTVVAGSFSFS